MQRSRRGIPASLGYDVKLGRGGIREIEFFIQLQQLIAGGKNPALRSIRTDEALSGLQMAGWIDAPVKDELERAYWLLRSYEHRIQMLHDEQSHSIPATKEEFAAFSRLLGSGSEQVERASYCHFTDCSRTLFKIS